MTTVVTMGAEYGHKIRECFANDAPRVCHLLLCSFSVLIAHTRAWGWSPGPLFVSSPGPIWPPAANPIRYIIRRLQWPCIIRKNAPGVFKLRSRPGTMTSGSPAARGQVGRVSWPPFSSAEKTSRSGGDNHDRLRQKRARLPPPQCERADNKPNPILATSPAWAKSAS